MRKRKLIEKDGKIKESLILETLLDIRDLLIKRNKQTKNLSKNQDGGK